MMWIGDRKDGVITTTNHLGRYYKAAARYLLKYTQTNVAGVAIG